jgi:hypothetical protein
MDSQRNGVLIPSVTEIVLFSIESNEAIKTTQIPVPSACSYFRDKGAGN